MKTRTPKELLVACGNTPEGTKAFQDVVRLALMCRQRLAKKACEVAGSTREAKDNARQEMSEYLQEYNSLRDAILSGISNKVLKVGREVTLDDLCSLKV
jgi:hypothetical protein